MVCRRLLTRQQSIAKLQEGRFNHRMEHLGRNERDEKIDHEPARMINLAIAVAENAAEHFVGQLVGEVEAVGESGTDGDEPRSVCERNAAATEGRDEYEGETEGEEQVSE